jgi:hypothetical protein
LIYVVLWNFNKNPFFSKLSKQLYLRFKKISMVICFEPSRSDFVLLLDIFKRDHKNRPQYRVVTGTHIYVHHVQSVFSSFYQSIITAL